MKNNRSSHCEELKATRQPQVLMKVIHEQQQKRSLRGAKGDVAILEAHLITINNIFEPHIKTGKLVLNN